MPLRVIFDSTCALWRIKIRFGEPKMRDTMTHVARRDEGGKPRTQMEREIIMAIISTTFFFQHTRTRFYD